MKSSYSDGDLDNARYGSEDEYNSEDDLMNEEDYDEDIGHHHIGTFGNNFDPKK